MGGGARSLDLALPPEAVELEESVRRFCERRLGKDVNARRDMPFSWELWAEMAALGLLEMAGTDMEQAQLFACIGAEQLGYHGFPGPVAQSIAAAAAGLADWDAVAAGERLATVGAGATVAWAALADDIVLITPAGLCSGIAGAAIDTLGRSAVAEVGAGAALPGDAHAVRARFDMALAAYTGGAGRFLVDIAADHARTRRQFGKALGEFQAVAFPLAEALMRLDGAQQLARAAALAIDAARADAADLAAAARLSASRAALRAAFAAHQTFGAYGVMEEGPVGWLSRRIQEYAVLEPSMRGIRQTLPLQGAAVLDPELWPVAEET